MRAALLALLVLATPGCRSARPPLEPLPIEISARESLPIASGVLEPREIAARAANGTLYVQQDSHAIRSLRGYAREVAESFLKLLVSPITAPVFVYDVFFGWLDFSITWGSGFIVDSSGHAVTNAHVVGDEEEVTVKIAGGDRLRAKVVAVDEPRDLALLKIVLPPRAILAQADVMPLGTSSTVHLGDRVVLYGFPTRPWDQSEPVPTVTAGVVSSLGLDVGEGAPRIQLDAAANRGSSGCPVFDDRGAVVGVITEAAQSFESQSFAIPIDDVKEAFFKRAGDDGHPH